ncbi:hypothetical protein [Malikia sp.]|uniref:phage tail assembly protein T n=1 Tax=Malikia sp. TaxID=2070706 RepID=UPI002634FEA7|nr:hypothetical protein [Malikia sp.]MDD2728325.1 hypothetical protein [Malikia sp.]
MLALALGKTVGELKRTMTQREFRDWIAFYRANPFDDLHRYHRPAALVAQSMSGTNVQGLIDWLHPPQWQDDLSQADINTLRALGIK